MNTKPASSSSTTTKTGAYRSFIGRRRATSSSEAFPQHNNESRQEKPITHLFFVVPGTGPHLENEKPAGNFLKNSRHESRNASHHSDLAHLSVPFIYRRMDKITLPTIPWIRSVNHNVIGDILYWFSRYNGTKLTQIVINELNIAYDKFISENPNFNGKIGLICHSLGGLICYDILYLQRRHSLLKAARESTEADFLLEKVNEKCPPLPDRDEDPDHLTLKFKPTYLYTMGSPIGGAMVFRNLSFDTYTIDCHFHNIFQPYDPFGYRTEPLADEAYIDEPAIPITTLPENQVVSATAISVFDGFSRPLASVGSRISRRLSVLPHPHFPRPLTPRASGLLSSARKSVEHQISHLASLVHNPLGHSRSEKTLKPYQHSPLAASCPDGFGSPVSATGHLFYGDENYSNDSLMYSRSQTNLGRSSNVSWYNSMVPKSSPGPAQINRRGSEAGSAKDKSLFDKLKSKSPLLRNRGKSISKSFSSAHSEGKATFEYSPSLRVESAHKHTSISQSIKSLFKRNFKKDGPVSSSLDTTPSTNNQSPAGLAASTSGSSPLSGASKSPHKNRNYMVFGPKSHENVGLNIKVGSPKAGAEYSPNHDIPHFERKDSDASSVDAMAKKIFSHIMMPKIERYPSEPAYSNKGYPRAHYEPHQLSPRQKNLQKSYDHHREPEAPNMSSRNSPSTMSIRDKSSKKRRSQRNFRRTTPQSILEMNISEINDNMAKGYVNQDAINELIRQMEETLSDPMVSKNLNTNHPTNQALSRLRVISATMKRKASAAVPAYRSQSEMPGDFSPRPPPPELRIENCSDDDSETTHHQSVNSSVSSLSTSSREYSDETRVNTDLDQYELKSPQTLIDLEGSVDNNQKDKKPIRTSQITISGANPIIAMMHQVLDVSNTESYSKVRTLEDLNSAHQSLNNSPECTNDDTDHQFPLVTPSTSSGNNSLRPSSGVEDSFTRRFPESAQVFDSTQQYSPNVETFNSYCGSPNVTVVSLKDSSGDSIHHSPSPVKKRTPVPRNVSGTSTILSSSRHQALHMRDSHVTATSGRVTFEEPASARFARINSDANDLMPVNEEDEDDNDEEEEDLLPPLPYSERMDYIISWEKRHLTSEYWLGLKGHFTYWNNKDVLYHILHYSVLNDNDDDDDNVGDVHVEDYDDLSIQLFRFDMDVYYGPTIGLTRSERWARAKSLGLKSPPQRVKKHLEDAKSLEKTGLQTSVFEHACQYGICPNARNEG
ncbi:hypothetical protein H4219_001676 [Mycoemilia scoparia]|uniref:DDHD domain-containing protein n=1 Tax=Mycoemilia scoparia TaxID=417184 RepID=A0A9W8A5A9_9FUNG|nr:hypothetical protein H4219_001676 [Mycoemilia scoparia]